MGQSVTNLGIVLLSELKIVQSAPNSMRNLKYLGTKVIILVAVSGVVGGGLLLE